MAKVWVDCGIEYGPGGISAGVTIVAQVSEDMCSQVIYPVALLKNSKYPEKAQAFLDYLQDDAAMQVFEEIGFSPSAAQ